MENLPELERFLAETSVVKDISEFKNMPNLKVVKIGMLGTTLDPLRKSANKLEEIQIRSDDLRDVSVIKSMENLKSLVLYRSDIEKLELNKDAVNLEKLLIGKSGIKQIPDISPYKKLKILQINNTEISEIQSIKDLPELVKIHIRDNEKLKRIGPIENLPKLKELQLSNMPIESYQTGLLPNLTKFELSGTNITRLKGFKNFPKLETLVVYETKLKSIKGIEEAGTRVGIRSDGSLKITKENNEIEDFMRERFRKKLFGN